MRLLTTCGAAIMAVLAFTALGAVTASTVSAALPEFLPSAGTFTIGSGAGTLEEGGQPAITCADDTGRGEITGAKTATISIDFLSCKVFGIIGAHSLGDLEGHMLVGGTGQLCYLDEFIKEVGIAIKLSALHVEVAGKLLLVTGTVIGKVRPVNFSNAVVEIILKEHSGIQEFTKCEGGATVHLSTAENEGTAKESGLQTTDEEIFAKAIEVMA